MIVTNLVSKDGRMGGGGKVLQGIQGAMNSRTAAYLMPDNPIGEKNMEHTTDPVSCKGRRAEKPPY